MKIGKTSKKPSDKREGKKPRIVPKDIEAKLRKMAEAILKKKGLKLPSDFKQKFISNFVHFVYIWFGYPLSEHDVEQAMDRVLKNLGKVKRTITKK